MEDITLRALILFRKTKYFFCEDRKTAKKLLGLLEIEYKDKEFYSLTSFTGPGKINHYLNIIRENDVVVVSEAGTPGLSDPGKMLIHQCSDQQIPYSVLPGANALVPGVVSAGFDTSKFTFLGFLPQKKGRLTILKEISAVSSKEGFGYMPVFFYESVHRVEKTLKQLKTFGFEGKICICREISKLHEQIVNAELDDVIEMMRKNEIVMKGEFVVGAYRAKALK